MEKNDVRKNFGDEVRKGRKFLFKKNNQTFFAEKVNFFYNGANLDQKKVSLIECGNDIELSVDLIENLYQFFKESGFDFNEKTKEDLKKHIENNPPKKRKKPKKCKPIVINEFRNLLSKPQQDVLSKYFGNYNCFFYSTNSREPKIVNGTMTISGNIIANCCDVSFSIPLDKEGGEKIYQGTFFYNQYYNMWYCILVGDAKQEICMIASQHINSTINDNLLNVAFVITTSAGTVKRPTIHRMFLSRKELSEEKKELILSQLKLNDDTIIISESQINRLYEKTSQLLKQTNDKKEHIILMAILKSLDEIRKHPCETYYKIDEATIYDTSNISEDKAILSCVVSELRKYTDNKYYNKLSNTVHEICTEIFEL